VIAVCQQCNSKYRIPEEKVGIRFRCKGCGSVVEATEGEAGDTPDKTGLPAQEPSASSPAEEDNENTAGLDPALPSFGDDSDASAFDDGPQTVSSDFPEFELDDEPEEPEEEEMPAFGEPQGTDQQPEETAMPSFGAPQEAPAQEAAVPTFGAAEEPDPQDMPSFGEAQADAGKMPSFGEPQPRQEEMPAFGEPQGTDQQPEETAMPSFGAPQEAPAQEAAVPTFGAAEEPDPQDMPSFGEAQADADEMPSFGIASQQQNVQPQPAGPLSEGMQPAAGMAPLPNGASEPADRPVRAVCLSCKARYRLPADYQNRAQLKCALCQQDVAVLGPGEDDPAPENLLAQKDAEITRLQQRIAELERERNLLYAQLNPGHPAPGKESFPRA
jgi:hypothetical protein